MTDDAPGPGDDLAAEGLAIDFDGVIADSMAAQEKIWRRVSRSFLGPETSVEEQLVRNLYAGHAGERMFEGVELTPDIRDRLRQEKDDAWEEHRSETPLLDGAREGLRQLGSRYPMAVATTADRAYVTAVLDREDLTREFEDLVTDADVERGKPAPDMLERIAQSLGVRLERLCMIGDSVTDAQMAEAAGSCFVLLTERSGRSDGAANTADAVVDSWSQLLELLLGR